MSKRTLIIVGLIVFGFSLLAHLPASLVIPEKLGALSFEGIEGTLWRGKFRQILWEKQLLPIDNLCWSLEPLPLLKGQLKLNFYQTEVVENQGEMRVMLPSMQVKLQRVHWQLPAMATTSMIQMPGVIPEGDVLIDIDKLEISLDKLFPDDLEGQVEWRHGAVKMGSEYWLIGSPLVRLNQRGDHIEGTVENDQPALPGRGFIHCTASNCRIDLDIRPTLEAAQSLVNLLALSGLRQDGGSWQGVIELQFQ